MELIVARVGLTFWHAFLAYWNRSLQMIVSSRVKAA